MTAITLDPSALRQGALLPQRPRGMGLGALLALLAHALLVAGLTLGLNWHTAAPEVVASAELWSAVPQVAAPAAVAPLLPPPPQPVTQPAPPLPEPVVTPPKAAPVERRVEPPPERNDAQIAIAKAERAKQLQAAEREQARKAAQALKVQQAADERARREKLKEDKRQKELAAQREAEREAKVQEQRVAKLRAENLKRMMGQAGATGAPTATGNAAHDAAPSAAYAGRIKARIKPNIVLTVEVTGNPVAEVEVRSAPDGTIIGRRIVKASGNAGWDDTVLRAIDRTGLLPRDVDGRIPPTMILVFPRQE